MFGTEHDKLADREHEELADKDQEELADKEHEVVKERPKRKEFEVFVGGLASEDDFKKVFSAVGENTKVRLMMNSQLRKITNLHFCNLQLLSKQQWYDPWSFFCGSC